MRHNACECDPWYKLISDIDNSKEYDEWEGSKRNETKWEGDNPEYAPEDEIDDCEYDCEYERARISILDCNTWEILRNQQYDKSGSEKLCKIFHKEGWNEVYTILPIQIFAKIISLC